MARAFSRARKDHRFYTIVEETIRQEFEYAYFVVENEQRRSLQAIQPFFLLDQDLVAGARRAFKKRWPRSARSGRAFSRRAP